MKFHINPTSGDPGLCRAQEGKCPFGADAPHFATREAARQYFERSQKEPFLTAVSKLGISTVNRALKWEDTIEYFDNNNVRPLNFEDLRNAAANAAVRGISAHVASSRLNSSKKGLDGEDLPTSTKYVLLATPEGDFVTVSYESEVLAYSEDGNYRYYPSLEVRYEYTDMEKAAEAFSKRARLSSLYHIDRDPSLSSFDRNDLQGAEHASRILAAEAETSGVVARVARLRHSTKEFNPEILTHYHYLGSPHPRLRMAVAGRKELPKSCHAELLKDSSPDVRSVLASRTDLDEETVERLLADSEQTHLDNSHKTVRNAMLESPGLPIGMMLRLVREGSPSDMRSLHRNENLSPEAREALNAKAKQLGIGL